MDMTCPACGSELRQVGAGVSCDACGLYMGGGGGGHGGRAVPGAVGSGGAGMGGTGWYQDHLKMVLIPPNPIFPEVQTVREGDRVGFKLHYGEDAGEILVGVVKSVDTDEETGEVRIALDDDTVTRLEGE
jgi:hypothetical protein